MEFDALGPMVFANQITLDGPDVPLRKSAVQTLSLALHELATNARKHGALATPAGRLHVSWRQQETKPREKWLMLDWTEDVPASLLAAACPQRNGYGRKLIEQALPYALDAETSYELGPQGVRCTIGLPLTRANQTETGNG
jgi:two-component sensor histidine kinase